MEIKNIENISCEETCNRQDCRMKGCLGGFDRYLIAPPIITDGVGGQFYLKDNNNQWWYTKDDNNWVKCEKPNYTITMTRSDTNYVIDESFVNDKKNEEYWEEHFISDKTKSTLITELPKSKPLVVNFFGGPGSGKSTTAAGLFHFLKMAEINCELITEFAKDLTWSEVPKAMKYQPYLFGEQAWRLERLNGLVDVVVTDSPLILSSVYASPEMPQAWHDFVLWEHNRRTTLDFFLKRVKKYNPIGRNQTEEEAKAVDDKILDTLTKMGVNFHEVLTGDGTAAIRAFGLVMKTLGKD